jgi:perosamine synthetase
MRSGMIAQGPEVAAFEQEFAVHFGLDRACVAVNSGTSGLHLGLLSAGVTAGDEVLVPSFTFAATANTVALTGATPVFADIDPVTFALEPGSVEASITERTVAGARVIVDGRSVIESPGWDKARIIRLGCPQ